MSEPQNVGKLDSYIRVLLGLVCLISVSYHFFISTLFHLIPLVLVIILIPFFLKTGLTKFCPIMKSMKISTN